MNDDQIDSSNSGDTPDKPASFAGKVVRGVARGIEGVQTKLAGWLGLILRVKNTQSDSASAAGAKGYMIGSGISRSERKANLMLYVITAFVVICVTWASIAELDQVTRGTGRVVPSRQVQLVQNLEGGIIERIMVREGEVVEVGDTLFILDKTTLKGQFDQGRQQQLVLKAKIARLTAQTNHSELVFPPDVVEEAPQVVSTEMRLFAGREAEMNSQIRYLEGQINQRKQELQEARVTLETAKAGIELAESEMRMLAPLVENGLEPEINLIQLQRTISGLQGKMQTSKYSITRTQAAIQEALDRVVASREKYRTDALMELSNATAQMGELEQTLPALRDKVARTELRAKVRGVVNRLLVNTEGGVVRPGEPLAELVPLDDTLVVEANIKPSDIAFLHIGQKVRINITAYDFAKYGGLEGSLTTISADAVQVSDTESAYVIQARTDTSTIHYNDEELEIIPGMVAEVNILTGKQTIMDYILTPILKVKDRALRE